MSYLVLFNNLVVFVSYFNKELLIDFFTKIWKNCFKAIRSSKQSFIAVLKNMLVNLAYLLFN